MPPAARGVTLVDHRGGEGFGVLHDLVGVGLEGGLKGFVEGDGLGGDDVHERAALGAGEHGLVEAFGEVVVVGEDEPAAGASQGLVGGGGDDVAVGGRARGGRCRR